MNFLNKVTGNDMTDEMKSYEVRIKKLPDDYRKVWRRSKSTYGVARILAAANSCRFLKVLLNFQRNLQDEKLSACEIFDSNVNEFCTTLTNDISSYQDKLREKLNKKVLKKTRRAGDLK